MNTIHFNIDHWIALAPGLTTQQDWQTWAKNPQLIDPQPPVADKIPPMMRRRMSPLSKLALQTALMITASNNIDYIVFSSRHGELHRTVKLIKDIINGDDASPIAFSQSVHNTAAGLYTIATKQPIAVTSLAGGENNLHMALIEVACYLNQYPHHRVLMVDFDQPLPIEYQQFEQYQYPSFALAMVISNGNNCQLSWRPTLKLTNEPQHSVSCYPQTLTIIKHLANKDNQWSINAQHQQWQWRYQS
ncbi:3-oxoacyl-ACP synthase [Photobacterium kishitanii]|uniref:beta-ketoacyl synthase chain length factor n=1 Tax=Photobacterium kishitanii TaxID=318456 RepID=UPI0007EFD89B|nr:beta-ketoacyl synthase chain length factor [Photobacterium kishitanii]OBU23942.1 3-oxoacyl-ACP synthase [Photobacterium kishitanii]PSU89644.1 3-oxoacyl-ACP synthase [Photobacterium kishitanii]PSW68125.1 3-oxoacyl-ACP synthase [Photobacterium kishitanii]